MILKPIEGTDFYFAGDDGYIYSIVAPGPNNKLKNPERLSCSRQSNYPYKIVSIKINGKRITKRVHRLICIAFHGNPPDINSVASHIDGNCDNNKPDNLCWETQKINLSRKKNHGTDDLGIKNSRAKINLDELKKIRKLLSEGLTHAKIGKILNVSRTFITKISNGYRYKGQGI